MAFTFTEEVLTKLWVDEGDDETEKRLALKEWTEDESMMLKAVMVVMERFKESSMVATDVIALADLRSLFVRLVKEVMEAQGWDKKDVIGAGAVLACLSAFGNKKSAISRMKRSAEFAEIMTKMKVTNEKYRTTFPTSFPLRFYARLFPMATHETAVAHVAPRFWALVSSVLTPLELKYAMENLMGFCYPGSAAALPKIEGGAMDMWIGLNTAISIIIGRKRDGSGVWKTASIMETVRFHSIAQQEKSWTARVLIRDLESFDTDGYLRKFCRNPMYSEHPLYGIKAPVKTE